MEVSVISRILVGWWCIIVVWLLQKPPKTSGNWKDFLTIILGDAIWLVFVELLASLWWICNVFWLGGQNNVWHCECTYSEGIENNPLALADAHLSHKTYEPKVSVFMSINFWENAFTQRWTWIAPCVNFACDLDRGCGVTAGRQRRFRDLEATIAETGSQACYHGSRGCSFWGKKCLSSSQLHLNQEYQWKWFHTRMLSQFIAIVRLTLAGKAVWEFKLLILASQEWFCFWEKKSIIGTLDVLRKRKTRSVQYLSNQTTSDHIYTN